MRQNDDRTSSKWRVLIWLLRGRPEGPRSGFGCGRRTERLVIRWIWVSSYFFLVLSTGCAQLQPYNELVMSPGMRIRATTAEGGIEITAGEGLRRSYTWEGATRSVVMVPRSERWYGSLGLYWPGFGYHWREHKGIARGVLQEGQQHFDSVREALDWIPSQDSYRPVYRDDGLMVGWRKTLSRKQLGVVVWQIYVNGKKPELLPGSTNDAIVVEMPRGATSR